MMSASPLGWLTELFRNNAEKTFLVWRERQFSFSWLLDHVSQWQDRLDESGVAPGAVVSIEGDYSPEAIALFIALIERGTIIVPLTTGVTTHHSEFRQIAEVQVVIAVSDGAQITNLSRPLENSLLRK